MKKKIILTGSLPPPYHGSSIYFYNLLKSGIKDVFDVSHLDISDHRNLDNLSTLDLTNVYLALKSIFSLRSMLKDINPDLVYIPVASNFLPYLRDGLLILTASFFSKTKIVIHLHEGKYFRDEFYEKSNAAVKYFIKKSLDKADTAVVLGESLKCIFKGLVKNIMVCCNGIDEDFMPDKGRILKQAGEKITVGFLGNLFESKGLLDVLNASVLVIKKHNNIEFLIAGASSEKENKTAKAAEDIISANNLKANIKFTGLIRDKEKKDFFDQSDMIVFPSHNEGSPLVIIEAMSAGLPVIATKDVGAIPDMVRDGVTGILVSRKNPGEIADAVIRLIEDGKLRLGMGMAGRKKFEEEYLMEKNISCMIDIFNKTINK